MKSVQPPERGDIVWVDLTPQAGHEQAGRRPALILTPFSYNSRAGLAIACPITSRVKGLPFEVPLPYDCQIKGVVLADHLRSIDWRARRSQSATQVGAAVLDEVCAKMVALLGLG